MSTTASGSGTASGETSTGILSKARIVLDCFLPDNAPLTLSEVQRKTGLPMTTTQRLLRSLVAEEFLVQTGGRYRLGLSLIAWASAARRGLNLVPISMPTMDRLRDATGETVTLLVHEELTRITIAFSQSAQAVAQNARLGEVVPLQAGSAGKVLLAWEPKLAERVLAKGLTAFTDNTVTDPDAFREQLEQTRERGYAISVGENADWVASVSAPVRNIDGDVVAALCLGGPIQRVDTDWLERHAKTVKEAAAEISAAIGWRDAPARTGSVR